MSFLHNIRVIKWNSNCHNHQVGEKLGSMDPRWASGSQLPHPLLCSLFLLFAFLMVGRSLIHTLGINLFWSSMELCVQNLGLALKQSFFPKKWLILGSLYVLCSTAQQEYEHAVKLHHVQPKKSKYTVRVHYFCLNVYCIMNPLHAECE